jgi:NADH-quinone oxidoreductase subunit L
MSVAAILSIAVCVWAWNKYKGATAFASGKSAFAKAIENKFYVDELYDVLFLKPYKALGGFLNNVVDKRGIDGIVNGVGRSVNYGSRQFRLLQSGQVGSYLLLMVVGMLILFIIQMFTK